MANILITKDVPLILFGFSKGASAVERYSLAHKINKTDIYYFCTCAATFTVLDKDIPF